MQFLTNLLPGLRDARSALIGGYGWLFVAYLFVGEVPDPTGTRFESLADAIGPLGVAIAVSFVAYLIGSFVEDLFSNVLSIRGARSLLADLPTRPPPQRGEVRMGETDPPSESDSAHGLAEAIERLPDRVWTEIEFLENQIDRGNSEVLMRFSLLLPLTIASIYLAIDESSWWALGLIGSAALGLQVALRTRRLRRELRKSAVVRSFFQTAFDEPPQPAEARAQ